jgi:hypothetical protein
MILHDKERIEKFLRKNEALNIYQIGDLDDFYWDYTIWFGLEKKENITAIALLYTAPDPPVLLALASENGLDYIKKLINTSLHILPSRFYSHLTPGLEIELEHKFKLVSHGKYQKMLLSDKSIVSEIYINGVVNLTQNDKHDIKKLFEESYPDNSFDPRMLISISGIHVFSKKYRVAALGNITTHPDFRGLGYGQKITAHLCKTLLKHVNLIGLNVRVDNSTAIKCYKNLGFEIVAPYMEHTAEKI